MELVAPTRAAGGADSSATGAPGGGIGGAGAGAAPAPAPKKSAYRGVSWDKQNGKWKAAIKVRRKNTNLGRFVDERLAAAAYDAACEKEGREVVNGTTDEERRAAMAVREQRPAPTSRYTGVCWNKIAGKWLAELRNNGKLESLGRFIVERDAAAAFDAACIRIGRKPVNGTSEAERSRVVSQLRAPPRARGSSRFLGVCRARNGKWQAKIRKAGKQVHLGLFATEQEAATAFDRHCLELGRPAPNAALLSELKASEAAATALLMLPSAPSPPPEAAGGGDSPVTSAAFSAAANGGGGAAAADGSGSVNSAPAAQSKAASDTESDEIEGKAGAAATAAVAAPSVEAAKAAKDGADKDEGAPAAKRARVSNR